MKSKGNLNDVLGIDILSLVLSYLDWKEILRARICKSWQEAASRTLVPTSCRVYRWKTTEEYWVRNLSCALALEWLADALPKLQRINFGRAGQSRASFSVKRGILAGDETTGGTNISSLRVSSARQEQFCLDTLEKFRHLLHLNLEQMRLVGSYPVLFDFPRLQTLNLAWNSRLVWDLSDLSGLPLLQRLHCSSNLELTGSVQSLRHLRSTLVEANFFGCRKVAGLFEDFLDFENLQMLDLRLTRVTVTGNIRNMGKGCLLARIPSPKR